MIAKIFLVPLFGVVALLTACSLPTKQADEQSTAQAVKESEQQQPHQPREVELTPDLLYDLLVAEFAGQRSNLRLAAYNYLQAARRTQDPRLARRATHFAIYAHDQNTALEAASLWVALAPEDSEAQQSIAALLIRQGEVDAAYPYLETIIITLEEGKQSALLLVANLLSRDKNKERALATMAKLIEPMPDDPHALYAYASLANNIGNNQEAIQTLERLIEIHGESRMALVLQAKVLDAMGQDEAALGRIARAVELEPDEYQLRLTYARMLVNLQKYPEAREQFRILGKQVQNNGDVLYALGLLALQAEDFDEAEYLFKRLVELDQHRDEAYFSLGEIAETKKQPNQAIKWFESVSEGKLYLDARLRAALIINKEQGLAAARDYLHKIPIHAQDEETRLIMIEGELLRNNEQFDEAMTIYNEGLERYPGDHKLLFVRAMLAERLNHLEMMESDLREILKQDPDNVQVLNALGYTLADRTLRYQEAYEYIRRALELSPDDPAIIDSMGWVLYRLGRYQESIKYLQRAADMQQDGEIAAHLGEVLWVSGNHDEARRVWDRALKFAPDHEILRQTIKRYTQ